MKKAALTGYPADYGLSVVYRCSVWWSVQISVYRIALHNPRIIRPGNEETVKNSVSENISVE
jgi:hypothetical protein